MRYYAVNIVHLYDLYVLTIKMAGIFVFHSVLIILMFYTCLVLLFYALQSVDIDFTTIHSSSGAQVQH